MTKHIQVQPIQKQSLFLLSNIYITSIYNKFIKNIYDNKVYKGDNTCELAYKGETNLSIIIHV